MAGGSDLEIAIPAGQFAPGGLAAGRPIHFNWALGDDDNGGAGDPRLIAFGTRLDPPETAWRWATLSTGVRDFVGLFDRPLGGGHPAARGQRPLVLGSPDRLARRWRGDAADDRRRRDLADCGHRPAGGRCLPVRGCRAGWAWHNGSHSLAHTTDGGATWQAQSTGTTG